jgi:hypothetical protein
MTQSINLLLKNYCLNASTAAGTLNNTAVDEGARFEDNALV